MACVTIVAFVRTTRFCGEPISGATIGRPVHYTDTAEGDALVLARMRRACELAGMPAVSFLEEPVAAAYAFQQQIEEPRTTFVFDFGFGSRQEMKQNFRCLAGVFRAPQFYDKWCKVDAKRDCWTEILRHLDGSTSRNRRRLWHGKLQEWVNEG